MDGSRGFLRSAPEISAPHAVDSGVTEIFDISYFTDLFEQFPALDSMYKSDRYILALGCESL